MKYCSNCGHTLTILVPEDDNRERHCCGNCGSIHYINPRIIVGTLPLWEEKILLCKRGIEPRMGYWTLPAGFLELGETTEDGALRETWEESRAEVSIDRLHGIYNIPHIGQVYFIYLARMKTPSFELTPESSQIELFSADEIPWENLAFSVMDKALRQYVSEEPATFPELHHTEISATPKH